MTQSRRSFLAQSSVFATFAISGTKSSAKIIGANDRIRVAVCGIKGRGNSHMGGLGRQKSVEISHLVDPDSGFSKAEATSLRKSSATPLNACRTCERFWRTVRSTSFPSPHPIIGTASCPSGPAKPARAFTSRNP